MIESTWTESMNGHEKKACFSKKLLEQVKWSIKKVWQQKKIEKEGYSGLYFSLNW
jgi:hypothetical protein